MHELHFTRTKRFVEILQSRKKQTPSTELHGKKSRKASAAIFLSNIYFPHLHIFAIEYFG